MVHLIAENRQCFEIKMNLDAEGKSYFLLLFSFLFLSFFSLPAVNKDVFKSLVFMLQANANKTVMAD